MRAFGNRRLEAGKMKNEVTNVVEEKIMEAATRTIEVQDDVDF